jgi:hypothetical protein
MTNNPCTAEFANRQCREPPVIAALMPQKSFYCNKKPLFSRHVLSSRLEISQRQGLGKIVKI